MRNAFADEITKLASVNEKVVLLSGDIGNRMFDKFKGIAPGRFYNCGVAEANMIGVAAGLAMSGMHPVVYTITPFTTTRVMEQIRVDVCYHNVPVTIVGTGSGLSYASLGPTHHSCEDLAMLRALPEMTVLAPGDPNEVRACLRAAIGHAGPAYMRIGKKGEPVIHAEVPDFSIGKSLVIQEGTTVTLLAVGVMLPTTLIVAEILKRHDISIRVVSVVSIKPLSLELLKESFSTSKIVATIEEHSLIGGFGSSVAEWLIDENIFSNSCLVRFGTKDKFIHESGGTKYARESQGLGAESIANRILNRLEEVGHLTETVHIA